MVLVQWDSGEPLVEHTVDLAVVVDAGIFRRGVKHQRAQPVDRGDRVDALPEQVRGVHLRADVGGAGAFDEALEGGRVEHQVLWVHLDGHLHAVFPCQHVDFGPERQGDLVPLVVQ